MAVAPRGVDLMARAWAPRGGPLVFACEPTGGAIPILVPLNAADRHRAA